jgi:peptidoglycan/LPS O-acetylase OafA/YrhL
MISSHIKPLTGVRFIAAFAVVLLHMHEKIEALHPVIDDARGVLLWGRQSVPFFFILSGFILSHVYFPDFKLANHGHFVWLRFARLWPVHVATIAGLVLYVGCLTVVRGYIPSPKYDFTRLLSELTMCRGWFDYTGQWNLPAWSIHAEWFAYIALFPLCGVLIRPLRNPWLLLGIAAACVIAHPFVQSVMPGQTGAIMCLFIAGSAVYRLRVVLPNAAGAVMVNAGAIVCVAGLVGENMTVTYAAFALLILGLSYQQGWLARLLSTRALVYGGEISFALYMSHSVVNVWAWELAGKLGLGNTATVTLTLSLALGVASLVHHLIEVPANQWLRSRWPNRKKPAATVAFSLSSP